MPKEMSVGCARPTGGPVGEGAKKASSKNEKEKEKTAVQEVSPMIQIGKKVPDFTAPGYHQGKFISIQLSEYLGKWVLLCFYPGDFTFV